MKIRTKLQITFFGIAFLLAASLMSIVYSSMVSHFEQQEGYRLKENVIQSAKEIDNFMYAWVKDFNMLSNNPLFSTSSNNTISNYLERVVAHYHFYEHISFINKDGIIIASSSQSEQGLKLIDFEPDMDGYEICNKLSYNGFPKSTVIIAVTSYAMGGDREKANEAGADGYLEKPIDPESFVKELENIVNGKGK